MPADSSFVVHVACGEKSFIQFIGSYKTLLPGIDFIFLDVSFRQIKR